MEMTQVRRLGRADLIEVVRFTDRERDVLWLVAQGVPNKAIALRLGISPATVAFYVSQLLRGLGLSNRTELAAWIIRNSEAVSTDGWCEMNRGVPEFIALKVAS